MVHWIASILVVRGDSFGGGNPRFSWSLYQSLSQCVHNIIIGVVTESDCAILHYIIIRTVQKPARFFIIIALHTTVRWNRLFSILAIALGDVLMSTSMMKCFKPPNTRLGLTYVSQYSCEVQHGGIQNC